MDRIASIKKILPEIYQPIKFLYKYRSMNSQGVQAIFTHRNIFLPDPTMFNDPFESMPNIKTPKNKYAQKLHLTELARHRAPFADKATIKKLVATTNYDVDKIKEAVGKFYKKFGIYSLSEKRDDILMWSHYSDGHKGICIEFAAADADSLFWEALKANYQSDYPIIDIRKMGDPETFKKVFLTKSLHWNYEAERRIIKSEKNGGSGTYSFKSNFLTGIILGALISDSDKQTVLNWIKQYPNPVNVYQAKINRTRYQLDIEKYNGGKEANRS